MVHLSVAAILLCEITSEGGVKPVRCPMNRHRHPGPTVIKNNVRIILLFERESQGISARRRSKAPVP